MINNPPSIDPRAVSYLLLAAFAMLAVLVYWPALSGPFLLDDLINIPQTRVDTLSVERLREVALGNDSGRFGRSIPVLTFALNYYFGGDGTFSFKLVNLALHLCNALLLFFLLSSLLRVIKSDHESEGSILQSIDVRMFSVLIAGIWMLHPLQLSAVMYVVQRMNMLSTFFTLFSLLLFVSLRTAQIQGTKSMSLRASLPAVTGVLLLVLFACLSKENGALAILYIGWIEFVVFRFRMNRETVHYRYRNSVIAGGVMLFCLGCLYFYLNQASLLHGYVIRDHSLIERLMTQAGVVLFYIRQILLPDVGQMSLYIDDFGVARELGLKTVLSISGIVLLSLVTLLVRRSHPLISLGLGIFLLSHILESTFIPLEMVFEHRNYFGLWGIVLAVVGFVAMFLARLRMQYRYLLVAVCFSMLSFQTYGRAVVWSDEFLHSAFAAESRPLSRRSQTAFAIALAKQGQHELAEKVIEHAEKNGMDPAYTALRLISLKGMRNGVQSEDIERALTAIPDQPLMIRHGSTLTDIRTNFLHDRFDRPDRGDMLALFETLVDHKQPRLKVLDRARLLGMYAELLKQDGQLDQALRRINEAYLFYPDETEVIVLKAEIEHAAGAEVAFKETMETIVGEAIELNTSQYQRIKKLLSASTLADVNAGADEVY